VITTQDVDKLVYVITIYVTCEVQKNKLILDKEDKCTGTEPRHAARKLNTKNTMEDYTIMILPSHSYYYINSLLRSTIITLGV